MDFFYNIVAVPKAFERDSRDVGMPVGPLIHARGEGKARLVVTVGVHHVDLGVAIPGTHERDPPPSADHAACVLVASSSVSCFDELALPAEYSPAAHRMLEKLTAA
jgi:hypothetical protein